MRLALLTGAVLLGAAVAFAWVVLAPASGVQGGPLLVEVPAQESAFGIARRLEDFTALLGEIQPDSRDFH